MAADSRDCAATGIVTWYSVDRHFECFVGWLINLMEQIPMYSLRNGQFHYRVYKEPAACPYPEPDKSSPRNYSLFFLLLYHAFL